MPSPAADIENWLKSPANLTSSIHNLESRNVATTHSPLTLFFKPPSPPLTEDEMASKDEIFYEPGKTDHGLPRDPYKSCVVPRPIGWISSKSKTGIDNLAPFSQFNNLTFDPPYVMFSSNQDLNEHRKDSVNNIESTQEFCWNVATWELREAVNASAEWLGPEIDEFERAGLEKEQAKLVNVPMVKRSPIKFECKYYSTLRLPGNPPMGSVDVVIGRVIGIHIDPRILTDGKIDLGKVQPIARCGYHEYAVVRGDAIFEMIIPGDPKQLVGLEGSSAKAKGLLNGSIRLRRPERKE